MFITKALRNTTYSKAFKPICDQILPDEEMHVVFLRLQSCNFILSYLKIFLWVECNTLSRIQIFYHCVYAHDFIVCVSTGGFFLFCTRKLSQQDFC